ncbi:hypothetical protein [Neobacillus dielmonensis]|uniref:hypothetical protein n=1 Tax=Neobacillus dielmonensis TaxID=1347369 RepID=UPI0005A8E84E|nr:hypothetical protein [Neobacillus dielmonensis]
MDQELIQPTVLTIKDKKQLVTGQVTRFAVYSRSKVVEVTSEDRGCYYLIYYKKHIVYGGILEQIPNNSFISKAFEKGIVLHSPHPLLRTVIPQLSVTIPNKNKLLSQLQIDYSLQESAYIAATLDAFFKKDQLAAFMDQVFYQLRRSGKFFKSYQILMLLSLFAPEYSQKHPLNSQEFISYHDFYDSSNLPKIVSKDPLYAEIYCFINRSQDKCWTFLSHLLIDVDGWTTLLLWLENAEQRSDTAVIEKYTAIALQFVTREEWILILGMANLNPYRVFDDAKAIIETMIKKDNYQEAALYLFNFIDELPDDYNDILQTIWKKSETNFILSYFDHYIRLLNRLPDNGESPEYEHKLLQLAFNLLEQYDLDTAYQKLFPIKKINPNSKVIEKIKLMQDLAEDPDRMMELGDYYAEFRQFDKAIDCFFWEMELDPQNPSPVQKISKMYQYKGMVKEAAAYQKVYAQLKSNQEAG